MRTAKYFFEKIESLITKNKFNIVEIEKIRNERKFKTICSSLETLNTNYKTIEREY